MKLVITVLLVCSTFQLSHSQKIFLYTEVDPYWNVNGISYWENVKGYGKQVPIEMINRIGNNHNEISKEFSLEAFKQIRQIAFVKEVERVENPTSVIPERTDFYVDIRGDFKRIIEKYPYYKKELGTSDVTIVYTMVVFNSMGEKVLSFETSQIVNISQAFKSELKGMTDYEKDIERVKSIYFFSIPPAVKELAAKLTSLNLSTPANSQEDYVKRFNQEVKLLFEGRKNLYPKYYSQLKLVSQTASRSVTNDEQVKNEREAAPYNDPGLGSELGNVLQSVTNYGLFIGVNEYSDPNVTDLDNPVNDANRLLEVLTSNYTFDKKNIVLLVNPSREEIMKSFDSFIQKVKSSDNFLVFFAGHGLWDSQLKKGYWLPSDALEGNRSNWLPNSDIRDYIGGIKAKHSILIADACFSGGIFKTREPFPLNKAAYEIYKLPSRKAMTSGAMKTVPDKSVFIEYLVKRLSENAKPYLTSEELFGSFKTAVINNSPVGQVPQFGEIHETGDEGGDFIFIKRNK